MTFWKLTLSYDGSPFWGWQVQPNRPTVQGTLAAAIEQVTGEQVLPQGSGRTDTGVHALGQAASFALGSSIPPANLLRALNRVLPRSIRVLAAEPAAPDFHARHSALRKTYEYRIFERKPRLQSLHGSSHERDPEPLRGAESNATPQRACGLDSKSASCALAERICLPFLAPFVWDCRWPLQLDAMQHAAALFRGTHDFTSFAASRPDLAQRAACSVSAPAEQAAICPPAIPAHPRGAAPNPTKTIFVSTCLREEGLLVYRITGSGFLHHMVRNIVGTLVEVGRGRLAADTIPRILAARDRAAAGPTAPACGLFLLHVDYGEAEAALSEDSTALSEDSEALSGGSTAPSRDSEASMRELQP